MKAAVITGIGQVEVLDVADPVAGAGEVVVRIGAAGLCTWEQRAYTGQQPVAYPLLGGHENAGEVVEVGPGVRHVSPGDRVTLGPAACGVCDACLRGEDKGCPEHFATFSLKGGDIGPGGFAEYKVHRADGVFPVGDAPWPVACLAEPLSCAVHAARLCGAALGDDAVVFGAGAMGLMNLLVLAASGMSVIVVEPDEQRRRTAVALGARLALPAHEAVAEEVRDLTGGGVSIAVAAVGSDAVNHAAHESLRPRGRLCLFASSHPMTPFAVDPNRVHNRETQIIGAVSAERRDHWCATRLIAANRIDLTPLVTEVVPLLEAPAAFERARAGTSYRVVLAP